MSENENEKIVTEN